MIFAKDKNKKGIHSFLKENDIKGIDEFIKSLTIEENQLIVTIQNNK